MSRTLLPTLSPLSCPIRPPPSQRLLDATFGFPSRGAVTGVESASLILEVKQLWPADGAYHCEHAGHLRRLRRGHVGSACLRLRQLSSPELERGSSPFRSATHAAGVVRLKSTDQTVRPAFSLRKNKRREPQTEENALLLGLEGR